MILNFSFLPGPPIVDCDSTDCVWLPGVGYLPDPLDCRSYYLCMKKESGGYKIHHRHCSDDLYWNIDKLTCDYAPYGGTDCPDNPVKLTSSVRPILGKYQANIHPIPFQCWASAKDSEPTMKRYRVNASCLLGKGNR